jgi:hypothetical protein
MNPPNGEHGEASIHDLGRVSDVNFTSNVAPFSCGFTTVTADLALSQQDPVSAQPDLACALGFTLSQHEPLLFSLAAFSPACMTVTVENAIKATNAVSFFMVVDWLRFREV